MNTLLKNIVTGVAVVMISREIIRRWPAGLQSTALLPVEASATTEIESETYV